MRVALLLALAVAVAAGGCAHTSVKATTSTTSSAAALPWPESTPHVVFGSVKSFTPLGRGYKLQLDLQLRFSVDKTGLAACIDNRECAPGTASFPDDTYDHDLKYVVTYYVPQTAPVDLVTFAGGSGYDRVTAAYLYGLSLGRNPDHLKEVTVGQNALHAFAFWVELAPESALPTTYDPVLRLAQQFHP
jgi:hypothetical protein